MRAATVRFQELAPSARAASVVAALELDSCALDAPRIVIPRAEPYLVVRFGPAARNGIDIHALGARGRARRKLICGGQRTVMVRLRLGTTQAVLGASASELVDRIVPLDELWGSGPARSLTDRLLRAQSEREAAAVLEGALVDRLATGTAGRARPRWVVDAAERLRTTEIHLVAGALGVSERNLRRVFRELVGMRPKAFARLARFHRALDHALRGAARAGGVGWASIARDAGYYDQAHLIAEFRALADVTPRALLGELEGGGHLTPRLASKRPPKDGR